MNLHDQSSPFSVQTPGLKSVRPLKTYVSPLRRGGLASEPPEPRGKEQEERRGEVKTAEEEKERKERKGEERRASFLGHFPAARF